MRKLCFAIVVVCCVYQSAAQTYYVATTGNDSSGGTLASPFRTIPKALSVATVPGTTIYVRGGTYAYSSTITVSRNGTSANLYKLFAYPGERAFLDFSAMPVSGSNRGINVSGDYWHIKGFDIWKAGDNGMNISGSNNTIEFCSFSENYDTGLQLGGAASDNQIINCDSYFNADPGHGNADGFAPKLDVGTGNYFYGCRAWQNSDDGWDGYMRPSDNVTTTLENCWVFRNGYLKNGNASTGNGNGFKLGGGDNGNADSLRHNMILKNCLAFDNRVKGYDQNNNRGSMTLLNCTAYRNGTNYQISGPIKSTSVVTVKNCVALGAYGSLGSYAIQSTNSWMPPFAVTGADFASIDTAGVRGPRNADGSLPTLSFMHLASGSDLINAGTNVGMPFNSSAPDLGCFETNDTTQVAGDFRTHQTGNWSDVSSWERFDGSTWVTPAPTVPGVADGLITIQSADTITVNTSVTVDQVVVNATATVNVAASQVLTVADGADSIDMIVSGTLNEFGTIAGTGRISIDSGGLFVYSVPGGADVVMPNYTWRNGSTCRIDSTTGTTPTNLKNQSLFNLIWNGTKSGANGGPNFNDGTVIGGDVTLLSSNSTQWRVTNLSGGQVKNIYIHGNLNVAGSAALLTSTGSGADTLAKAVITIDGDVNLTAGTWNLCNSSNAYAEWKVKGDIGITGGTLLASGASGWPGRRMLNFSGDTTQSFTVSAPGAIGTVAATFKVSNGSAVQINFPFTLMSAGSINLESGTFVTTGTNKITVPANGTILGGNTSSYVDGPLSAIVASTNPTTKIFPVGKEGIYRPVTLTVNHASATATAYTAELFNAAPAPRTLPGTLSAVSSVRYHNIAKGAGASLSPVLGATVQLNYGVDDSVANATMLRVAKDDSSGNWLNLGGSGTADTTGSITSNAFFSFSDFVLATADTSLPPVIPTLSSTAMSYISTTSARSGGNVLNDGGAAITERGVCWNTSGSPTVADSRTSDGTGSGVFASQIVGLTPAGTYYLRSYATNSAGSGYGDEISFSTLASIVPPGVTTTSISSIQVATAIGGGNVTDWGGDSVTARGICWNTTGAPTTANNHSIDGGGLGSFTSGLSSLTGGTFYHVRAYATNSAGIGYGNEVTFTTQTPQPDTTVFVDQDGSGDYLTVQAAFNAAPIGYTGNWTIFVRRGVYYEKCILAAGKTHIILQGEDRDSTIITYDDYADRYGTGNPGTSGSYSVAIDASDFIAKDITFRNTYFPQVGVVGTQAVALRTQGDRHEYINCNILGYQDTYYTWGGNGTGRMYHKNCFIEGIVDFIFGRNIVVFDSCTIHVIRNAGTLTAGSTDATSKFGYVFRNCTMLADSIGYDGTPITSFYLGRPWQASPRTVFLHCSEPLSLHTAGWLAWNVTPGLYAEYNCFGPGAGTSGRVNWSSQLSDSAAGTYTLARIFARSSAVSNLILFDWMPANASGDPSIGVPAHFVTPETSLSFGNVFVTSGKTDSIVVKNTGLGVMNISAISSTNPGEFVVIEAVPLSVPAGDSTWIHVTFQPASTGVRDGWIIFTHNGGTSPDSISVEGTGTSSVSVSIPVTSGWNMISNPLTVSNDSVRALFPASSTPYAFRFNPDSGYAQSYAMTNGRGYWAKFPVAASQSVAGLPRTRDSISVVPGWNMTGSISEPVDTSTITSIPAGLKASSWFGYAGGYSATGQLEPGKAYWIKSNGTGKFVLAGTLLPARPGTAGGDPLASLNTLTITDGDGGSQTLYFGAPENEMPAALYAMPPVPPVGAFDARFETSDGGSMVKTHPKDGSHVPEFAVTMQSSSYPLTITWNMSNSAASYELHDGVDGHAFQPKIIKGEGSVEIVGSGLKTIYVKLIDDQGLPEEFSLSQNYPNPFNPATNIRLSLPVHSMVQAEIYNLLGQRVATIMHEDLAAGYHTIEWDGKGNLGQQLGSGTYFLQLDVSGSNGAKLNEVRKLLMMR